MGDETHFIGESLWEHGYYRAFNSLVGARQTYSAPLFFSRAAGLYKGDQVAISNFETLISAGSAANAPNSKGSIGWGLDCVPNGSYTFTGGARVVTNSGTLYSFGYGDDITFDANADYSGGVGFQSESHNRYQLLSGRGHKLWDAGSSAIGTFSKYSLASQTAADPKTGQLANPVVFQLGIGDTDANRRNAITARKSGSVEIDVNHNADPEQKKEINFSYVNNSALRVKMRGDDGIVRFVDLKLML